MSLSEGNGISSIWGTIKNSDLKWRMLLILAIPQTMMLIVFRPGFLMFDYMITVLNVHRGTPNQWHSVIWGFIAEPIIYGPGGLFAYGVLQTTLQIIIVWAALLRLRKINIVGDRGAIILSLIYGLCPTYLMYGVLWGADIIFAVLMMLLTVMLMEMVHDRTIITDKRWVTGLMLTMLMLTQLRKNALFIVPIVGIILWFYCRGMDRRRFAWSVLATMLVVIGLMSAFTAMGVTPSPVQEAVAIPVQQVGAVAHYDGSVTDDSMAVFERVRPWDEWAGLYDQSNADPERMGITDDNFNWEFIRAWIETGFKNPGIYLRSYNNLEYPYWRLSVNYLDSTGLDMVDDDYDDFLRNEYCTKDPIPQCEMLQDDIIPPHSSAQEWLARLYGNIVYNNVPIVSDLFSLVFFNAALPLWTALVTLIMVKRKREWLVIMSPFAYIVLSLLAFSSIAEPRYAMELYWAIPVVWSWILADKRGWPNRFSPATIAETNGSEDNDDNNDTRP